MNVKRGFAIFGAGRYQKIFRIQPLLQFFKHRAALGNGFNQKVFGARKRVVDRRSSKCHSDIDDGSSLESERLEMFEEKTETSHRRICAHQPQPENLEHMIDAAETGRDERLHESPVVQLA